MFTCLLQIRNESSRNASSCVCLTGRKTAPCQAADRGHRLRPSANNSRLLMQRRRAITWRSTARPACARRPRRPTAQATSLPTCATSTSAPSIRFLKLPPSSAISYRSNASESEAESEMITSRARLRLFPYRKSHGRISVTFCKFRLRPLRFYFVFAIANACILHVYTLIHCIVQSLAVLIQLS